jgi:hypothetical protein
MRPFVALPLLLLLTSCGPRTSADPSAPPPPETTVEVRNQKLVDMTVYALNGGRRIRLGLVPAVSTRTFTVPPTFVFEMATLRFLADPVGSNAQQFSEELLVHPGDQVSLTLPP